MFRNSLIFKVSAQVLICDFDHNLKLVLFLNFLQEVMFRCNFDQFDSFMIGIFHIKFLGRYPFLSAGYISICLGLNLGNFL